MNGVLLRRAIKLNNSRKHRKWWQRSVRVIAMIVVFCTTYALILPAITMEGKPECGMEAHTHEQTCYFHQTEYRYLCLPEADAKVVHSHNEFCYDKDGNLVCPLPEIAEHAHTDACYETESVLICTNVHAHDEQCNQREKVLICEKEECAPHAHDENCNVTQTVLICQIPESEEHVHSNACYTVRETSCSIAETEGHTHGDECYEEREILCELTTNDGHVHEDSCYETRKTVICGLEELVIHTHGAECVDSAGNLICEMAEVIAHDHTADCRIETEDKETLICQIPEHVHNELCYPMKEEEQDQHSEYLCGFSVHTHGESCYNEKNECICTVPEHKHEASCIVENLDVNADVETEAEWMKSVSAMTLTGDWPADVLAVAQTQLEYKESVQNVILAEDTLKGYTRYGAWHGDPYADWNALFVAFCLEYAAVKNFKVENNAAAWVETLAEKDLYKTADWYSPKPGDLIFVDPDQLPDAEEPVEKIADLVGIVAEILEATETTPAQIKLIAGDWENQVSYVTYDLKDPAIIGYGQMPLGDFQVLTYTGEDYTVTVTYTSEANIPESAELAVREVMPGTEEYDGYYSQALEALKDSSAAEEAPEVSFARFFDISFVVDGEILEPAAPVEIAIVYHNTIPVTVEENGQVVHFAKDGVEVLNTNTGLTEFQQTENDETTRVDTFHFTQGSFSVTGTLISARAITTATKVNPWEIDNTGNTMYVLYAQINGRYYALSGTADSRPVEISVSGNNITLPSTNTYNLFWTFVDKPNDNGNYLYNPVTNVGTGRYLHPFYNAQNNQNITTGNPYDLSLVVSNDSFKIRGNNNFVRFTTATAQVLPTSDQNQATNFYVAAVGAGAAGSYNIWFDGTVGGMMSYYGAANENIPVVPETNGTAVVELPETWQSSTKYDYVLKGWYDINNQKYYPVNPNDNVQPTATVTGNTVFYADWIAATYDVGQQNEHVVNSIDTNDFITTHVFDYNALFNVMSQSHTGSITASGHSENWTIYNNGETVPYQNGKSLGFAFVDYDTGGEFSYANGRDETNYSRDVITSGILTEVANNSGQDLLDLLFNHETEVIGKHYVGTGNYLFQYMDSTTANYDGEHDGYYYLDARLNAASYNQSQQRFYLYDYLERTSDSRKDGGAGQYSDLLPFNSPYIFDASQVDTYVDSVNRPGYEYDAKDTLYQNNIQYSEYGDANTNYFFGLRTDIEFFLPNDTNTQDEYGNYGNVSTRGEHMVFDFHGDDDVWVFVDGKLLLDIGGLHGIMHGRIDFSTGTISYGADGKENVSTFSMPEGTHHMSVYYMERGSSQSNCAIYFNIAPRYDLEITKEDIVMADKLNGAVFSIFNDEALTEPAELWNSFEDHEAGLPSTNTFTVVDGVAKCWGISAGKTYYIYETTPPPGYPASDDMIRITLNNRGTATIETTTLHGQNGVATEGFAVIKQDVNDTLKVVALTFTNQMEGDTTEVRVEKAWDANSTSLPQYITVYLTADGKRIGRSARLTESNGWSYTWTGLPKYRSEGIDEEVEYVVEEVFVPNYITVQGDSVKVENYVDWVRVDQMSDSKTFLLVHNGQALTYNGSFGWMDRTAAEADDSRAAHWNVTTDHDGFHLKNGLGYTLTYGSSGFYGINSDASALNQVFYYLNSRLMVHDHDVYYQFGANGAVVQEDGLAFQLYQKETLTGLLTNIVNKPVDEEKQTFVEVNKVWQDGAQNHEDDVVLIRLYADGKDTGRELILNAANNWSGSFDDLPYYQDGTTTKIQYTIVEDPINSYLPSYSDPTVLPGRPVSFWQNVQTLTAGSQAHRIYANGYSLAVVNNDITSVVNDLDDTAQQWIVESSSRGLLLKNVGTGRYLRRNNMDLTTTSWSSQAAVVTINNGYFMIDSYYLELGYGYAGVTSKASNIHKEAFHVTHWTNSNGMEGVGYTVTNIPAGYRLPDTGGAGTSFYTLSGLLVVTVAAGYVILTARKRQKGGNRE